MNERNMIYARIPNNFFYNNGEMLDLIGGKYSFVLYCLLTSRKNMCDEVHINIKEINNILQLYKSLKKARVDIILYLEKLKNAGLVDYEVELDCISYNDFFVINWINKFPKPDDFGWTKFYADDFKVHSKVNNIPYCVMWVLRMYTNFEKKVSFISISDITSILRCDRVKVQNSINLFDVTELFEVIKGDYYFHTEYGRRIKMNNSYGYTGDIGVLLSKDSNYIETILDKNI